MNKEFFRSRKIMTVNYAIQYHKHRLNQIRKTRFVKGLCTEREHGSKNELA